MTPIAWGLGGLLVGSFLTVVIWRVPRNASLGAPSACTSCKQMLTAWQGIPVLSWVILRGRCAGCGGAVSKRYVVVELSTALAFGCLAWWFLIEDPASLFAASGILPAIAAWCAFVAYLWFAAASIALAAIDIELQRLPDAIVISSLVVVAGLLGAAALLRADAFQLISVAGGAAALFLFYFVIRLVAPRSMGAGDVKLAAVIGAALGFFGWNVVVLGAFAGLFLGGALGLLSIAIRRGRVQQAIAFGPSMLLGAWLGIVVGSRFLVAVVP